MIVSSFRQDLVGSREVAGSYVSGRWVPGASSPINFRASVQPITGDQQQTLPEGIRERGRYVLYTDFALQSENQTTKEPGDIIDLFSKKYKVIFCEPWQNSVINHYKAIVSEVDV